ncbi:hypothetical protein ATI61_105277 [Archangium gephyra]|uniref:Multicopper oxidase n=1 Tax=Archangium gephyra TaxID=48 RepID=A0ABX9K220_9BACT|nr:hypothetical protein [Archangium gephyra]REG31950.1 hypothetical protein ATI61_105277 [Archangium gephyra]
MQRTVVAAVVGVCIVALGVGVVTREQEPQAPAAAAAQQPVASVVACARTISASVVVMDQPLMFNRLGAQNVNGMMYALSRDVINLDSGLPLTRGGAPVPGRVALRPDKRPRPLVLRAAEGDCLRVSLTNLLTPAANPRSPPTLINRLRFNLPLNEQVADRTVGFTVPGLQLVGTIADDSSFAGRNASSLVSPGRGAVYNLLAVEEGTFLATSDGAPFGGEGGYGNGTNGLFAAVNVEPRGASFYRSQVTEEELRLSTTGTSPTGHPLINYEAVYPAVEPWLGEGKSGLPILNMLTSSGELVHTDINAIIMGPLGDGSFPPSTYPLESVGRRNPSVPNRLEAFREFTSLFHDEVAAANAFPGYFEDPVLGYTLEGVRDAFMINYGSAGIGSEIIANRLSVGPMHDCLDCAYEDFFLSSFAVGDAAMVVDVPANIGLETLRPGVAPPPGASGPKATRAFFPEDPSNVSHSYLSDFVKFRNLHVGKEHHVFHLHNHQWLFNPNDDNSNYIDAQGIGSGSGYTYEISFGGSGNRNLSAGDAIFHCHFYPHFAQGMWAMWRIHDTFEAGTKLAVSGTGFHTAPFSLQDGRPAVGARALPDGELVAGTPIPAVVPLPGKAMAPMPGRVEVVPSPNITTASTFHPLNPGARVPVGSNARVIDRTTNPGYPFWIAGIENIVGQRPTTPPLDMLSEAEAAALQSGTNPLFAGRAELVAGAGGFTGGLPRHALEGVAAGGEAESTLSRLDFSKEMLKARPVYFPEEGTDVEQTAMLFHSRPIHPSTTLRRDGSSVPGNFRTNGLPPVPSAPFFEPCRDDAGNPILAGVAPRFFDGAGGLGTTGAVQFGARNPRVYKGANIQLDVVFNKVGYHYPQERILTLWEDVTPTLNKTRPPEPFVIRFNTFDCGKYLHTNLIPKYFELDDFQVRSPTDVIGQHIHLPKWDLPSADGAANGWNYEDGTLAPGAVRERIEAINTYNTTPGVTPVPAPDGRITLTPLPHPFFGAGPGGEWLGARTTLQRWFFDPVVNAQGVHRGLGVIFTHDHLGPSTHQQVGLYGSVITEPPGSTWRHNETGVPLGTRSDGGPTSWQAAILTGDLDGDGLNDSYREFWFQASDFQHAYEAGVYVGAGPDGRPGPGTAPTAATFRNAIGPPHRLQASPVFPDLFVNAATCPGGVPRPCPQAISVDDPGMLVVNYRNEPVGLRVYDPGKVGPDGKPGSQATGLAGDLAFALQTRRDRAISALNTALGNTPYPALTADIDGGDPFTPLIRTYMGDRVRVKFQVGGHEEEFNATIHGVKWLQAGSSYGSSPNSGWRNAQAQGISEQFTFTVPLLPALGQAGARVDYAYGLNSSQDGWWSGAWGLMRSYNTPRTDLFPLPTTRAPLRIANPADFSADAGGACPRAAPVRAYDITAVLANTALTSPAGVSLVPSDASATLHVGAPLDPRGGTLVYNPRRTALSNGESGPLHDPTAILYVRTADLDPTTGKLLPGVPIEPLVLRAAAGECIEVTLRNRLPADVNGNTFFDDNPDLANLTSLIGVVNRDRSNPQGVTTFNNNLIRPSSWVGLHPQLVAYDPTKADGTNVGNNPQQLVSPGGQARYRWYAGDISGTPGNTRAVTLVATPLEFGGTNLIPADKVKQGQKSLVGALIIEPAGSAWTEDASRRAAASVGPDANRDGRPDSTAFRDFAVVWQKQLSHRYADGTAVENVAAEQLISEDSQDSGQMAINYGSEPLWFRFGLRPNAPLGNTAGGYGAVPDAFTAYSNSRGGGDPVTPVFTAAPGQQARMRLVEPHGSYRGSSFRLHGHGWQRDPYICPGSANLGLPGKCSATELGSRALGVNPVGMYLGAQESVHPYTHFEIFLPSAGGANAVPGDYLFRDYESLGNICGQWGLLRVQ